MHRALAAVKLRQITYFLAVADTLSFTRAAQRLGATQPTLSHQIAELELTLGAGLFDRVGKTVRLTEAGHLFRGFAMRATQQLEGGLAALAELEGLTRGSLRLGVTQSLSHTILPPVLGEFLSRHPGIQVSLTEANALGIERGLLEGLFDLGIAFAPAVRPETDVEPILKEALLLIVGSNHPLAGGPSIRMSRLHRLRMILLDESYSTRRLVDGYIRQAGAEPEVVVTTNAISVMLATVSHTDLATIVPENAFSEERYPELIRVSLTEPTPYRVAALLWPGGQFRTLAARTFGELVRRHYQGREGGPGRSPG